VEKGTFQATKPPNIYGNNRHLTKDTNYTISYDANIGKNKTIYIPGVLNSIKDPLTNEIISETPADISYRLIENTLGVQFYRIRKYDFNDYNYYFGYGCGVQNFPYGSLMFGLNEKFVEIGGAIFWGITIDKASYEGEMDGAPINDRYIKLKNIYVLHSYSGAVAHASVYFKKIALSYSISPASPWIANELPVSKDEEADLAFAFPYLLMQDIGISYTPNKIKYRLGVNQITGDFPGHYWGLSVQVAYGW
jgi:hypothetical protein